MDLKQESVLLSQLVPPLQGQLIQLGGGGSPRLLEAGVFRAHIGGGPRRGSQIRAFVSPQRRESDPAASAFTRSSLVTTCPERYSSAVTKPEY